MFDNPFSMVVAIILIVTVGKILTSRHRQERGEDGQDRAPRTGDAATENENQRLREELRSMKERLAVLERIATDKEDSGARLDREIEKLRDRNNP